jgi:hypothetical protein
MSAPAHRSGHTRKQHPRDRSLQTMHRQRRFAIAAPSAWQSIGDRETLQRSHPVASAAYDQRKSCFTSRSDHRSVRPVRGTAKAPSQNIDPRNGDTLRMYKCECGEQTWTPTESKDPLPPVPGPADRRISCGVCRIVQVARRLAARRHRIYRMLCMRTGFRCRRA